MGNADREIAHRYGKEKGLDNLITDMNHWCTDQLTDEQLYFLKNLPEKEEMEISGLGKVLFVHDLL